MKFWKSLTLGCAVAALLVTLTACSDTTEQPDPTPTTTPVATESTSPTPTEIPNATPRATASSSDAVKEGETMQVTFIGRADTTTVELMVNEQVKTAQLDAEMQKRIAALDLQDNQSVTITYEMQEGQMVITDIEK